VLCCILTRAKAADSSEFAKLTSSPSMAVGDRSFTSQGGVPMQGYRRRSCW
jgi:hypothetical protein